MHAFLHLHACLITLTYMHADGYYTPTEGSGPCTQCEPGGYIEITWKTAECKRCPAGTAPKNASTPKQCYGDAVNFWCCVDCEPGGYM